MGHVHLTGHAKVPVDRCFELGIRAERIPEWNSQIVEIRDVTGPLDRTGTSFTVVMRVAGRRLEGRMEIAAVERPHLITLVGKTPGGGDLTWTRRFSAAGDGTDIVVDLDYELPGGFVGSAADRLFIERSVQREGRHSVENYVDIVEHEVPIPA